jgi:hypothetical protein
MVQGSCQLCRLSNHFWQSVLKEIVVGSGVDCGDDILRVSKLLLIAVVPLRQVHVPCCPGLASVLVPRVRGCIDRVYKSLDPLIGMGT